MPHSALAEHSGGWLPSPTWLSAHKLNQDKERGPEQNLFRNMYFDAQTFLNVSNGKRGTSQTVLW